ncbi:MAG: F0F1 ATP synthase subunit A [Thermoleophilia bacterium]
MDISPDSTIIWSWGFVRISLTLVYTWVVMALLVLLAWLATRKLSVGPAISRWQNFFETVITLVQRHIREIIGAEPARYLPFLGTLFLFISLSNLLVIIPGTHAPTGSLSTTAALALSVFFAVPIYSIAEHGVRGHLRHYIQPTPLMLPFHILGEFTRTLTLAVRLFGSIMSEMMIAAALLAVIPFLLPVVMKLFGLLIGQIQAYIFAVLAAIYIASAVASGEQTKNNATKKGGKQWRASPS